MAITDLTPNDGLEAADDTGDGRELKATYETSGGAAATVSAGDVTLTITAPDGTETTKTGSDLSVSSGVVTYDHVFDTPGLWRWRFVWDDGTNLPQVEAARVFVHDAEQ